MTEKNSTKIFCPDCNHELKADEKVCPECKLNIAAFDIVNRVLSVNEKRNLARKKKEEDEDPLTGIFS